MILAKICYDADDPHHDLSPNIDDDDVETQDSDTENSLVTAIADHTATLPSLTPVAPLPNPLCAQVALPRPLPEPRARGVAPRGVRQHNTRTVLVEERTNSTRIMRVVLGVINDDDDDCDDGV